MKRVRKTRSAGGVVLNKGGLVLVVSQFGTSWSLPKGHVDEGEEEIEAARREIYEEAGIRDLELVKDLGSYKRCKINEHAEDDESEMKTIHMFLFRTSDSVLKPVDSENPEARWVRKESVVKLLTHEKDRKFFLSVIVRVVP